MENTLKEFKNAEGLDLCTCIDCKKQFAPYQIEIECSQCEDGDYLYEREDYEGGSYYGKCRCCNGHGSYTYTEKRRCQPCNDDYEYFSDNDDY